VSGIFYPAHRYVPGVNGRHADAFFDPLKTDVTKGMTEAQMQASLAWQAGAAYRAQGYFWECHEVLEALWIAAPDGPVRSYIQAVIQMANAQLKVKMGRPKATLRLCECVCTHLNACETRTMVLGQRVENLRAEAQCLARQAKDALKCNKSVKYRSFDAGDQPNDVA